MGKSKKTSSKKSKTKIAYDDDGNIKDERFKIAQTHPQFQKRHTQKQKKDDGAGGLLLSELNTQQHDGDKDADANNTTREGKDDRFSAIFTDSRFSLGGGDIGADGKGVDKYGRTQKKKKKKKNKDKEKEKEDVQEDDTDSNSESDSDEENDNDENNDEPQDVESRIAFLTALSRGEVDVSSSDEDDSSDDESQADKDINLDVHSSDDESTGSEDSVLGRAGVLDPSSESHAAINPPPEVDFFESSKYLALCNMDWSSTRAVDLLVIASSFAPPGTVRSVKVFPSDFGLEKMSQDLTLGPRSIWKKNKDKNRGGEDPDGDETDEDNHSGSDLDNELSNPHDDGDGDDSDLDSEMNEEEMIRATYKNFDSSANNDEGLDNDFDTEKLRAYEASKLKYYFAVLEFTSYDATDVAYKELDGMEIGHSSTTMDLRAIPEDEVDNVIKGRELRDGASSIPSNYSPPDFVVEALQSTSVKCTWDEGDKNRERLLTQYGVGNAAWTAMTEGDDLKAYLASDGSSDENEEEGEDENGGTEKKSKVKNMRALLGLDGSGDDDSDNFLQDDAKTSDSDDDSFFGSRNLDSDGDVDEDEGQEVTFVPGKNILGEKIRSKLKKKDNDALQELTPWEKYQEKRKEKRKEKKRLKKMDKSDVRGEDSDGDDPFSPDGISSLKKSKTKSKKHDKKKKKKPSTKEELELLIAGDEDEETAKDFHMRDLVRIDKNKSKKLRGPRKKKESDIRENASGMEFKLDTKDDRFAAVLEGSDDRFGIDRTNPQYKETPAMRQILKEQTKRRKSKKRSRDKNEDVEGYHKKSSANNLDRSDMNADAMTSSSGALALSSLVKNLKSKVAKTSN